MPRADAPCIYAICHRANGRFYSGSTVNSTARWWAHRRALQLGRHHCKALQAAWDGDEPGAFTHVVLERVGTYHALHAAETRWLRRYELTGRLYNTITHRGTRLGEADLRRVESRPSAGYPKGRPRAAR